ncbi:MAG: gliding motility-associated C-terminal domain-containing protein [Flavobacteriales bacterium]
MKFFIFSIYTLALLFSFKSYCQYNIPEELEVCPGTSSFQLEMNFAPDQATILSQVSNATYTQLSLGDDDFSALINLGFNFTFYGNTYSSCVLSTNNFLSFDASKANTPCDFTTTTTLGSGSPSDLKNSILAPFQDINPLDGGTMEYATIGTAPNRAFVARWYDVPMFNCTELTFCSALIIYEGTNNIETHLINKPICSDWQSGLAIHGLINSTGSLTEVIYDNDELVNRDHGNVWTTSIEGSRFVPNGNSDYTHSYIDFLPIVSLANTTYTDNLGNSYTAQQSTTIQNVPGLSAIYASSSICSESLRDTTYIIPTSVDILIDGNAVNSHSFCPEETVTLSVENASEYSSFSWNSGQTTASITVNTPGLYTVNAIKNGCSIQTSVNLSHFTGLNINLGQDTTLCIGQSLTLNAFASNITSYTWSTGETSSSISVNSNGEYIVSATSINGCTDSDTIQVNFVNLPAINLGSDLSGCEGDTFNIGQTIPFASYLWSNGDTTSHINATTSGTYSLTATIGNCSETDEILITINPIPTINLDDTTSFCSGSDATIDAYHSEFATYLWQDGSTNSNYTANSTGLVWVTVTLNGCSFTDSTQVIEIPNPIVNLGPDTAMCEGEILTLEVQENNATYSWSTTETSQNINITTTGTYMVEVTKNGCSSFDTITVTFNQTPTFNLGNDIEFCEGDSTTLNAFYNSSATYLWHNGSTNASYTTSSSELVWVTITLGECHFSDTIQITEHPNPVVNLGNDITICEGDTQLLSVQENDATYLWNTGETTQTISVTTTNNYSVDVTKNGCTTSDTIHVQFNTVPEIDLGNPLEICENDSVQISAYFNASATYLWHDGSTDSVYTSYNTELVWVTVSLENCEFTDSVQVTQHPTPNPNLGQDTTLCEGEVVELDETIPGATYLWSTGETTPIISVTTTGNYWVQVSIGNCIESDSISITFEESPIINLGTDVELCEGDSSVFNAFYNASATYEWHDGSTNPTYISNSTELVWVEVTLGNCSFTDSVNVTVYPYPEVDLGNDIVLCEGDDQILEVQENGATYIWSTGATTQSITVNTTNDYSVQVTKNGCTSFDTIHVQFNDVPNINLGTDVELCEGDSSVFNAFYNASATYEWHDGSTNSTYTSNSTELVWVTVTLANCTFTDSVNVTVFPYPEVDLGNDIVLCEGDEQLLEVQENGAVYNWSTGATTQSITVNTTNDYSVQVTKNGCTSFDTIHVQFNDVPNINLGTDVELCEGDSSVFNAFYNASATYEWHDGSTNSTYTSNSTELVWVTVTLANCTFTDSVNVTVFPYPEVDLGNDIVLCEGDEQLLEVQENGATYIWNTGATTQSITVNTTNDYSVQVTKNGCTSFDTVHVQFNDVPNINLGTAVELCEGDSSVFNAFYNASATYEWHDGSTNSTYTSNTTELVWVTVTLANCTFTDTVNVTVFPYPEINLGNDIVECEEIPINIQVSENNATYLWNTGDTTQQISPTISGEYSVEVSKNGCTSFDTILVTIKDVPQISLGNDTTICEGDSVIFDAYYSPQSTYLWHDGSTNSTYVGKTTENITVEVSLDGCAHIETVQLTVNPIPTINLEQVYEICEDETLPLDVSYTASSTYQWSTSSTQASENITQAGDYWVIVTDKGCSKLHEFKVVVNAKPNLTLENDTICLGESLAVNAFHSSIQSYLWSTGETSSSIEIDEEGWYWVDLENDKCLARDSFYLKINSIPVSNLPEDTVFCDDLQDPILLDATSPNASYLWSTGSTDSAIVIEEIGQFWVKVSNGCGVRTDTIRIFPADCDCQVYTPNAVIYNSNTETGTFKVASDCELNRYSLKIFNRWGQMVFESNTMENHWTPNQENIDIQDVYIFEIEYESKKGILKQKMGSLILIH